MNERAIFDAALEIDDPQKRSAYLNQVCGKDAKLREHIEGLLCAHASLGSFLVDPAVGPVSGQPRTVDAAEIIEQPGTVIGPYKLLQQIGEGGMGTVFMAEQTHPVRRRVALKVIKAGMDSRQVIARFDAERQALAMMDHVNIARVLDAGATPSGRPYFVMELVHGVPITQYCDENHLTPRERLELFVPVCQAIQHAHQKGVIHRDIKPSNVMVTLYDGKPVPKVIDFGVAKATEQRLTEQTLFTQYGNMVGTPEYMSPEQAAMSALGVDTRSDIYSLGVLLYELLTGSTPLTHKRVREAAYTEVVRMINKEEPPKPSSRLIDSGEALASISAERHTEPAKLIRLLRGELDWIVMKALEKDRSRRYATANAFAGDVDRYLTDEPVLACPPSTWYRFRKFAQRNKAVLITAGVITAALFTGTLVSTWQAVRATNAESLAQTRLEAESEARRQVGKALKQAQANYDLAEEQRKTAETQRQEAEQARRLAIANLRTAQNAVDQMLTEVGYVDLATVPQMEPVRRALLEKALKFYQGFLDDHSTDPAIRFETAHAYRRMARIYDQLGQVADAEQAVRQAIDTLEGLIAEYPAEPGYRSALAWSYDNLANVLIHLLRFSQAEGAARQSVALRRKLSAEFPTEASYRYDLTNSLIALSTVLLQLGRHREAEDVIRESLGILERLVATAPSNHRYRNRLALGYDALVGILRQDRPQEAEDVMRQAIPLMERLVSEFPDSPEHRHALAHQRLKLGLVLMARERLQDAENEIRESLALGAKASADFPNTTQFRAGLAESQHYLAALLAKTGRLEEAEVLYLQAIENREKLLAEAPSRLSYKAQLALTYSDWGMWLTRLGRSDQAEAPLRRAIMLGEELDQQFASPQGTNGPHRLARDYQRLGDALTAAGRLQEAEATYRRAVAFHEALVADNPDDSSYRVILTRSMQQLGQCLVSLGRLQDALACHEKLLELNPASADEHDKLAWLLATAADPTLRNPSRAIELAQKAIELTPARARYWRTLGVAQYRAGDWQSALESLRKSIELSSDGDGFAWFFLAMAHWQLAEKEKASDWFGKAVHWMDQHQPNSEELRRFRGEAAELLGVEEMSD